MEDRASIKPDMAEMLELSLWEIKTTMINMLGVLMGKVNSKKESMDNASREIEILKEKY